MEIRKTALEGVLLFEPTIYRDERGFFYENWRKDVYEEAGITEPFLQDDISVSHQNVLRGLHCHPKQGQLLSVLQGEIFDVVVDLRPFSQTFKRWISVALSGESPQQIYMPPGCGHGFYVKSVQAILHYKCTQYYNPQEEFGIIWNDPTLAIDWPTNTPILSQRDQAFPILCEKNLFSAVGL